MSEESGNHNGHTAIHEHFQLLQHHLPLPERVLMISDRGTFSAGHVARLQRHGYHVLCSANWRDFQGLYDTHKSQLHWQRASYLSIEQQRRRNTGSSLPREHYDLAVLNHELTDPATGAAVPCRLIFVFSSADAKVCQQTRQRDLERLRTGLDRIAATVAKGHPRTKLADVPRRVAKLLGQKSVAKYVHWELQPLTPEAQAALPAPARGCRQPTHRFVYTLDEAAAQADTEYDGLSVLVTTVPRTDSADRLFSQFKEQNYLKTGHHQYKTPLAVSPVFLKSPRRVEALVCLLQIALQVYQMLERLSRQRVPAAAPRSEKRLSAETILRTFEVQGLLVEQTVTQTNAGKRTPGVDNILVKTPRARGEMVDRLSTFQPWRSKPVRRVYILKSNGKQRPLGIPTVQDRCLQAMVKNALEPEWEARFEGSSYGFRPGRGCQDAIAKIYQLCRPHKRKKWILDTDIQGAYDW